MKIALAQINPTIGDIDGNTARIVEGIDKARRLSADLVVFPELCVFGYPPKDLLDRAALVRHNVDALERIAKDCIGITAIVGYARPAPHDHGPGVLNEVAVCHDGRVVASHSKMLLPSYDVFDESRYFSRGTKATVVTIPAGDTTVRLGLSVCEDLWNDHQFEGRRVYGVDPIAMAVEAGAELIINVSASPYRAGIQPHREKIFTKQMRSHGVGLVYVNQVGGNDDLIFDGASMVINGDGEIVARAPAFEEALHFVDLGSASANDVAPYPDRVPGIRQALVLGLADYARKCGFENVVIGLSGGIDSAVTAALAIEALGPEHVHGVAMPSRYSSEGSLEDARQLAENFSIPFSIIPITDVHREFEKALDPHFCGSEPGVAEENVQARIRGNILMALSNKFGSLLLSTGNKSELAVGYCTLYGDMCGGLALLSDVPKTTVYELAELINSSNDPHRPIPTSTIEKPPSAELRADQTDQDTLPPYETLDPILERYVEQTETVDEIVAAGFQRDTVERVAGMVDGAEYKRKQAPIGLKVTARAFGTGRRMPIAAKYPQP